MGLSAGRQVEVWPTAQIERTKGGGSRFVRLASCEGRGARGSYNVRPSSGPTSPVATLLLEPRLPPP